MAAIRTLTVDVLILGGGAAGLWLLDELRRASRASLLLEAGDLGSGQTILSQGIIHGGMKYSLAGMFSGSAEAIRDMPLLWRRCLAGEIEPDLGRVTVRADHCHLWQTDSLMSRLGMLGARAGLRVTPLSLEAHQRPTALMPCPGVVARLDEQVIDPASLLHVLRDRNRELLLKIDAASGLEFGQGPGSLGVRAELINPSTGDPLRIEAGLAVFCAGAGNEQLRRLAGLAGEMMQLRPLHMVVLRGKLPTLNGHCVDGAKTRITVTTAVDSAGQIVWQIGGELAERGVGMKPPDLLRLARQELGSVLPGVALTGMQWATYPAQRAEGRAGGRRPDDITLIRDGALITAWPTKLALAPRLAQRVLSEMDHPVAGGPVQRPDDWPSPAVALPPWEGPLSWMMDP